MVLSKKLIFLVSYGKTQFDYTISLEFECIIVVKLELVIRKRKNYRKKGAPFKQYSVHHNGERIMVLCAIQYIPMYEKLKTMISDEY